MTPEPTHDPACDCSFCKAQRTVEGLTTDQPPDLFKDWTTEHTGGNVYIATFETNDGRLIVFTSDAIYEYKTPEHFENHDQPLQQIYLYGEDPNPCTIKQTGDKEP